MTRTVGDLLRDGVSLFAFCPTSGCERAYIGARLDLGRTDPALRVDLLAFTLCCDICRAERPRLVPAGG